MFLNIQIEYLLWLQNFRELTHGFFDPFFLAVTHFGEFLIFTAFLTLIYWSLNKKTGEFLIITNVFSILCNQFIKMTACIERPWILSDKIKPVSDAIPKATGYSFPSGHTARAMSVWGGLAVWFWDKKIIRYSMFLLILLIAFSRNYLVVHTLQDVVVSFVIGLILLYFLKKIFDKIDGDNNIDLKIFLFGIIAAAIMTSTVVFKYYHFDSQKISSYIYQLPSFCFHCGYIIGTFLGWFACRKLITFETENISVLTKILRFVFGYSFLLILLYQVVNIFISDFGKCRGNFIGAFVIGLFITFLYPWVFTRVERFLKNNKSLKE